jgi:hypothetical protein
MHWFSEVNWRRRWGAACSTLFSSDTGDRTYGITSRSWGNNTVYVELFLRVADP